MSHIKNATGESDEEPVIPVLRSTTTSPSPVQKKAKGCDVSVEDGASPKKARIEGGYVVVSVKHPADKFTTAAGSGLMVIPKNTGGKVTASLYYREPRGNKWLQQHVVNLELPKNDIVLKVSCVWGRANRIWMSVVLKSETWSVFRLELIPQTTKTETAWNALLVSFPMDRRNATSIVQVPGTVCNTGGSVLLVTGSGDKKKLWHWTQTSCARCFQDGFEANDTPIDVAVGRPYALVTTKRGQILQFQQPVDDRDPFQNWYFLGRLPGFGFNSHSEMEQDIARIQNSEDFPITQAEATAQGGMQTSAKTEITIFHGRSAIIDMNGDLWTWGTPYQPSSTYSHTLGHYVEELDGEGSDPGRGVCTPTLVNGPWKVDDKKRGHVKAVTFGDPRAILCTAAPDNRVYVTNPKTGMFEEVKGVGGGDDEITCVEACGNMLCVVCGNRMYTMCSDEESDPYSQPWSEVSWGARHFVPPRGRTAARY